MVVADHGADGVHYVRGFDHVNGLRQTRRGTSLTEVLVALVVLTIGLTSVIALFPVGVNRVRNATLDTRTTLMGMSAPDLFQLKRMGNDSNIINWAAYDASGNPPNPRVLDHYSANGNLFRNKFSFVPPANGFGLVLRNLATLPSLRGGDTLLYLSADDDNVPRDPNADLSAAGAGEYTAMSLTVRSPAPGYDLSYPILLDPFLFDQLAINFRLHSRDTTTGYSDPFPQGVPRIPIATPLVDATNVAVNGFPGLYPAAGVSYAEIPYCDIPVLTLAEIGNVPWIEGFAGVEPWPVERDMVKHRWFASAADVQYTPDIPGFVRNPSAQDYQSPTTAPGGALLVSDYYWPRGIDGNRPRQANPVRPTAIRTYDYTWAAMMQRSLQGEESVDSTDPAVGRPNPAEREFRGKLAILCFYRRNLNQPFTVIEGCFYSGSRKVTLSWPSAGVTAPTINVGTWLCEASISRSTFPETIGGGLLTGACNRHTGFYPALDDTIDGADDGDTRVRRQYRRSFSFHRVIEVGQPQVMNMPIGPPRVFLDVLVERPAQGFPLKWGDDAIQDTRGPDTAYMTPRWPIFDPVLTSGAVNGLNSSTPPIYSALQADDESAFSQGTAAGQLGGASTSIPYAQPVQYYPVIIFDGLREVFERTL